MEYKEMFRLLSRYILICALGLFGLPLIYKIFYPLTVYPVFYLLKFTFSNVVLLKEVNTIFISGSYINIIEACIAGAAYYLLIFLNLATPMSLRERSKVIFVSILLFLILNIGRIYIFANLYVHGYTYFDLAHKMVWYFGSTILIVGIWFFCLWSIDVESIPIYTDVLSIIKEIKK